MKDIKPGSYHYFIIEDVNKIKSKYSGELYKVIQKLCKELTNKNNLKYKKFICNLLWQLALLIYTFIKEGYTHCDIHPKNIFVKIVDEPKHYPDIKLSSSSSSSSGPSYAISIIDFGETVSSKRKCRSLRKKSKVLASSGCDKWKKYDISRNMGSNISALYHLPVWTKRKRSKTKFNSDIWFYYSLLQSIKLFPKEQLKKLEKFINKVDMGNKSWSNNNLINFINLLIMLFKSIIPINELNILQLNQNNKSKYSLVDTKLAKRLYI
jgi:hypothetical protein